jgi:hypothetical protein
MRLYFGQAAFGALMFRLLRVQFGAQVQYSLHAEVESALRRELATVGCGLAADAELVVLALLAVLVVLCADELLRWWRPRCLNSSVLPNSDCCNWSLESEVVVEAIVNVAEILRLGLSSSSSTLRSACI